MPDMLVRLYDLPDPEPYYRRAREAGAIIRRAEPWDRFALRSFIEANFWEAWAPEADLAFSGHPITGFVSVIEGRIACFAVYECSRRGYFGPTGVREDLRGRGLGAALLFRCLESMREMGYGYAVIGGVGPAVFYEKVCGAFVIPGSETGVYRSVYEELRDRQAAEQGKQPG
jgi:GNAT superfamily N-acetyltransferase